MFTKALKPEKWQNAMDLLGMRCTGQVDKEIDVAAALVDKGAIPVGYVGEAIPTGMAEPTKLDQGYSGKPVPCGIATLQTTFKQAAENLSSLEDGSGWFTDQADELREVEKVVLAQAEATPTAPTSTRPSGKLPGWGQVIEVCTPKDSTLGQVAQEFGNVSVYRITEEDDFRRPQTQQNIRQHLIDNPGCSLHGSLPCTVWSTW